MPMDMPADSIIDFILDTIINNNLQDFITLFDKYTNKMIFNSIIITNKLLDLERLNFLEWIVNNYQYYPAIESIGDILDYKEISKINIDILSAYVNMLPNNMEHLIDIFRQLIFNNSDNNSDNKLKFLIDVNIILPDFIYDNLFQSRKLNIIEYTIEKGMGIPNFSLNAVSFGIMYSENDDQINFLFKYGYDFTIDDNYILKKVIHSNLVNKWQIIKKLIEFGCDATDVNNILAKYQIKSSVYHDLIALGIDNELLLMAFYQ